MEPFHSRDSAMLQFTELKNPNEQDKKLGAGELTQQLREPDALAGDRGSAPSTHTWWLTTVR